MNPSRPAVLWILFLAVFALTQLVYGAVATWALGATAVLLAGLNVLACVLLPGGLRLSRVALAWLGVVGGVFLLQLLPLGFLFPRATELRGIHGAGALWPATADLHLTVRSLAQLSVYVLAALLVLKLRAEGLGGTEALKGLGAVLVLHALYGIIQKYAGIERAPFHDGQIGGIGSARGTFVNRNTFAGVMAMGFVVAAALAYSRFAWKKKKADGKRTESGLLWAAAAGLFAFALVLSKSRGGALGALAGLVALPFLFRGKASAGGTFAVVGLAAVGVALADPSVLLERFGELDPFEIDENSRAVIWRTTIAAASKQPLLGFGVGTHRYAYHPDQPADLPSQVDHAHNEYVNFFLEGGVVLVLAMLGGLVAWGVRSWKAMQRLPGPERFMPTAALAAALTQVVHSVVDFDCRVTSAGMLFAALVALAAAPIRPPGEPGRKAWGAAIAAALISSAALLLPIDTPALVEEALKSDPARAEALATRALGLSPFQSQAAWVLGWTAEKRGDLRLADGRYGVAADLWPAHPGLQRGVGAWFWARWRETGDRAMHDRAAASLKRLFLQKPREVERFMVGAWAEEVALADYESLLPDSAKAKGVFAGFLAGRGDWERGLASFERNVPPTEENAAVYDVFAGALNRVSQFGLEALIRDRRLKVKSDPAAHGAAARAWARLEAWDAALERVQVAARTDPGNAEWVSLRGDILRGRGDKDAALEAYVQAIRLAPLDVSQLLKRAALYGEMSLPAEAAQDLRVYLRAKPGDRPATLSLARALAAAKDVLGARRVLDDWQAKNPQDAEASALRATLGP
jgi:tetratricopeptide (TPR) repeat protein